MILCINLFYFGCIGVFVPVGGLSPVAVRVGYSLAVMYGLLTVVAPPVAEHRP